MSVTPATEPAPQGTPCWLELGTTNLPACTDFYAGLLGWEYQPDDSGYLTAHTDGVPAAGLYAFPDGPPLPTTWTLYLSVNNVANTAQRVTMLDGQVAVEPREIPGQGRLMIAADPTGALIGFWEPATMWPFAQGGAGAFAWADLHTTDGKLADEFFVSLFSFDTEQVGDGIDYDYTIWTLDGPSLLGRLRMGAEFEPGTPPHWMNYVGVSAALGVDLAATRAIQLGGRLHAEPFDSPYGRIAVIEDVAGGVLSLVDTSRRTPIAEEDIGTAAVDDPYDD
ncbi:hypothetical protein EV193_10836 [Herbihabitans rhizosphaerae]|uniref:VOC domain-containing protein n=1 Tax=Herbihabitans rhizosphaerae TaxID=1872711 RepID=A0A4Q7KIE5_9PSEU|nr:VOC family protein [Herbihabitans rhizosphaerae]RZS34688.1 hypothetical protein EV193_10836 [Herbihabitans rhizosphaerae]